VGAVDKGVKRIQNSNQKKKGKVRGGGGERGGGRARGVREKKDSFQKEGTSRAQPFCGGEKKEAGEKGTASRRWGVLM